MTLDILNKIIKLANQNDGFLSILLFITALLFGWFSGLFNSIINKPKLKIRFIDKLSFYSFFYTGGKLFNEKLKETFDLHKTGFVVYMSIANIGNKVTSIDKIYLGYYKNTTQKQYFKKDKIWLAQWHSIEPFRIEFNNGYILEVPTLRIKNNIYDNSSDSKIESGDSIIGVAYFEQEAAWGNYNPANWDENHIKAIIKIRDVYGKHYYFKTKLKFLDIEKARKYNPHFGNIEQITTLKD